jgi:hypothetical protein
MADVPGDEAAIVSAAAGTVTAEDGELKNTAPVTPPMSAVLAVAYCCPQ